MTNPSSFLALHRVSIIFVHKPVSARLITLFSPNTADATPTGRLTEDVTLVLLQALPLPSQTETLSVVTICASKYKNIGTLLLRDEDGSIVSNIKMANHDVPEAIMADIFQRWISSQDHSWKVLIECLKKCSLNTLAKNIEKALR